jgi:hypothetical protein
MGHSSQVRAESLGAISENVLHLHNAEWKQMLWYSEVPWYIAHSKCVVNAYAQSTPTMQIARSNLC